MITKYMQLDLPVPGTTKGPTWAWQINEAFRKIDEHDHTSGKGKYISSSSILVGGDINFTPSTTAYGIKNAKYFQFTDRQPLGTPDTDGALFNWRGDLWWQQDTTGTGTGTFVQITAYDTPFSRTCSLEPISIAESSYYISKGEKISAAFVYSQPTTITIPYASTAGMGRFYLIQDVGGNASTNNITISPQSTDYIGTGTLGANATISTDWGYKWIMSNGYTRWLILTEN